MSANHDITASSFLKDEKFIEWKLTPSNEIDKYWKDFLKDNPESYEAFKEAEILFGQIKFTGNSLTQDERKQLWERINQANKDVPKRKHVQIFIRYAAAVCLAIAISIGFYKYIANNVTNDFQANDAVIVGNALNDRDIVLTTSEKKLAFDSNIDMQVGEDGAVTISENSGKRTDVALSESMNRITVPYGKRTKIELQDKSIVWINSGSILEFPTVFSGNTRDIHLLAGEIYIEVAKDNKRSFYVHAPDYRVKVYGTAFNVTAYNDLPSSIVLVEGQVSLSSSVNYKKETLLLPGEIAVYLGNDSFSKQRTDISKHISWKNGYLLFDDTPIQEVLKQIERYYNLSFSYDRSCVLQKRTCSGKIHLSDNIDDVMKTIAILTSTNYKREDKTIYISPSEKQ
ncbi:MAG: DUF4974 domain-containing protein [Porphyromonadaceae bacterium]|nr:DUF4974 domain-containing protein [Porphyromonadaceae bacterium]